MIRIALPKPWTGKVTNRRGWDRNWRNTKKKLVSKHAAEKKKKKKKRSRALVSKYIQPSPPKREHVIPGKRSDQNSKKRIAKP